MKKPQNRRTLFSSRHSPVFSFGEIRPYIVYFSFGYRIYRKEGRTESYRSIPRYYITCSTLTKQNCSRKEGRKGPFLPFPLVFGYTGAHWEAKTAGNGSCPMYSEEYDANTATVVGRVVEVDKITRYKGQIMRRVSAHKIYSSTLVQDCTASCVC